MSYMESFIAKNVMCKTPKLMSINGFGECACYPLVSIDYVLIENGVGSEHKYAQEIGIAFINDCYDFYIVGQMFAESYSIFANPEYDMSIRIFCQRYDFISNDDNLLYYILSEFDISGSYAGLLYCISSDGKLHQLKDFSKEHKNIVWSFMNSYV